MTYIETSLALERMTDHPRFELMASTLLAREDPRIRPIGGASDRARDAVGGLFRFGEGEELICMFSLEDDWAAKIRRELDRIKQKGWSPKEVIAVTSQPTGNPTVNALQEQAGASGIDLTVIGQKALAVKLETPANLDLREEYLGLPRPRHPFFLTPEEFAALLTSRGASLETPHVGRADDFEAVGRALEERKSVMLEGDGGIGKSRLALELATLGGRSLDFFYAPDGMRFEADMISELGSGSEREVVVAIDDAHRREDLRSIVDALLRRDPPAGILLIARPGFQDKIAANLDRLLAKPLHQHTLRPLRSREIAAILREPPFSVTRESLLAAIVDASAGNPQLAGIAGTLAARGEKLESLPRDEIFRKYADSVVDAAASGSIEREELLRLITAVRALDEDDERVIDAVERLLGIGRVELRRHLHILADAGPVVERNGSYTVKPDMLAEQLLRLSFFDIGRVPSLRYDQIYSEFAPFRRTALLEALGAAGVSEEASDRLELVRRDLLSRIERLGADGAAIYARFIRALAPGVPLLAQELYDRLLTRIASLDDAAADEVATELVGALLRLAFIDLAWPRLLALGEVAIGRDLEKAAKQWEEAVTSIYRRLPIDMYPDEGRTLAVVQEVISVESERYWDTSLKTKEAAGVAAIASRALLTTTFDSFRHAADDGNRILMRAHSLPASPHTRKALAQGARLFRESFELLTPRKQVEQLDALDETVRVASGFGGSFGHPPGEELAALAREILSSEIDPWLSGALEWLPLPVAADAHDYFSWRARHDANVCVPDLPGELREYYDLVHPNHHRELGEDYEGELERQRELGRKYAQELCDAKEPVRVVTRFERWLSEALEAKQQLPWHPSLQALFDEVPRIDRTIAVTIADHLRETGGLILPYASGVVRAALEESAKDTPGSIEEWLTASDGRVRAVLPWAVEGLGETLERKVFERLAQDPDKSVRHAVWHRLFINHETTWRMKLFIDLNDPTRPEYLASLVREGADEQTSPDEEIIDLIRNKVIASAEVESINGHSIREALAQLAALGVDVVFQWLEKRINWMIDGDRHSYRDVPEEVLSLLGEERRADWRSELTQLVALYEIDGLPYGVRGTLAHAIAETGGDSAELTEIVERWTREGEPGLERVYGVIANPTGFDAFTERAKILLAAADTQATHEVLTSAGEEHVFGGAISAHHRARAERLRPWRGSDDPRLAGFARRAIADLEAAAARHEEREREEEDF